MHLITQNADTQLAEWALRTRKTATPVQIAILHFSRLNTQHSGSGPRRIAVNILTDHYRNTDAYIFLCDDHEVVVVHPEGDTATLHHALHKVRYLFADDPLAYTDFGEENPAFATCYTLPAEWEACLAWIHPRQEDTALAHALLHTQPSVPVPTPPTLSTVDALHILTRHIPTLDIAPALQLQPVCAIRPGTAPTPLWHETYIHLSHFYSLAGLPPGISFPDSLFGYITELADSKLLEHLAARTQTPPTSPLSINLNISTILAPEFVALDATLSAAWRKHMIIEVQLTDIFASMDAFHAARDILRSTGYRVCIDGITPHTLCHVDRMALACDVMKVRWCGPSAWADIPYDTLQTAVQQSGPHRIVLCRCDHAQAITFGQRFGIGLFQGRYVDGLL